jgi:acetyl-CoA decarbonylase/synthase complex subunit alpha
VSKLTTGSFSIEDLESVQITINNLESVQITINNIVGVAKEAAEEKVK